MVKYNGSWWYVHNGKVDFSSKTLCKYNGIWWYIDNGKVNFSATTVCEYDKKLFYVENGKVDFSANKLVKCNNKGYYIVNGEVDYRRSPIAVPPYSNPCPYQLNVITTYQGHEGMFTNGEGGYETEIELTKDYWEKGGVTNRVETFIGEYDDCISPNNPTGSVRFEYFYWTEN